MHASSLCLTREGLWPAGAQKSPPQRSPSAGGPARRVSEGDSEGDEFQDASEALPAQPGLGPSGRTI